MSRWLLFWLVFSFVPFSLALSQFDFDGDGVDQLVSFRRIGEQQLSWNGVDTHDFSLRALGDFGLVDDQVAPGYWIDKQNAAPGVVRRESINGILYFRILTPAGGDVNQIVMEPLPRGVRASVMTGVDFDGNGLSDVALVRRGHASKAYWYLIMNPFVKSEQKKIQFVLGKGEHLPINFTLAKKASLGTVLRYGQGKRVTTIEYCRLPCKRTREMRIPGPPFVGRPGVMISESGQRLFVLRDSTPEMGTDRYRILNRRGKQLDSFSSPKGTRLVYGRFGGGVIAEIFPESVQLLGATGQVQVHVALHVDMIQESNTVDYPPGDGSPGVVPTVIASTTPVPSSTTLPTSVPATLTPIIWEPTAIVVVTSTATLTSTPTATNTATPTNAPPVGMVVCSPGVVVGEALSNYTVTCSGGSDPEGGTLRYQFLNTSGSCPSSIDLTTGTISSTFVPVEGSCSYQVQVCDIQGACGANSTINQIHSYALAVVAAGGAAVVNQSGNDCSLSLPVTVTQSSNVSNLQFGGTMAGLSSLAVNASGMSGVVQPGVANVSGNFVAQGGTVAGVPIPSKSVNLNASLNLNATPFPAQVYTPSAAMFNNTQEGVQLSVSKNGADCLTCNGQRASISAGYFHSCVVGDDNKAWCWGNNDYGQLGTGNLTDSVYPVQVTGLSDVVQVSSGNTHSCAIVGALKEVWCWGRNNRGQLGNNSMIDSLVPVKVQGLSDVAFVGVNWDETSCALRVDKTMWWGYSSHGYLGSAMPWYTGITTPVQFPGLSDVVSFAMGYAHACILAQGGEAKCWGFNWNGQLGDGTTVATSTPVLVNVPVGQKIAGIVAPKDLNYRTLYLMDSGQLWQSGLPAFLRETVGGTVQMIQMGSTIGCYINLQDGRESCAGYSLGGELIGSARPGVTQGTGARGIAGPPGQTVTGLETGVVASSVGSTHVCSVLSSGEVRCFGNNHWGMLGNGQSDTRPLPATAFSSLSVERVAGTLYSTCVITTGGTVYCVGRNAWGELGNGTSSNSTTPLQVSGISSASRICGRSEYSQEGFCAIDGITVKCWGFRYLGDGSAGASSIPVTVSGLTDITPVDITCGGDNACVLASSGEVRCWGSGGLGSLGNGATSTSLMPVSVTGLGAPAIAIGSSRDTFCAGLQGGGVKCWGAGGAGTLGNGTTTDSSTPVSVSGITDTVVSIAHYGGGGDDPAICASLSGGGVRCWSSTYLPWLGNGTGSSSSIPVPVSGYDTVNVSEVAMGDDHACVLRADGQVACWGSGFFGATGLDTATDILTPQLVPGITNAIRLSAGVYNTCAVLADHTTKCWGFGTYGNLGDNYVAPLTASNPVRFADSSIFRARVQQCYKVSSN